MGIRGDNGRRARAWPRIEGECPTCRRWLALRKDKKIPRHRCGEIFAGGTTPLSVYHPNPGFDQ